MWRDPSIRYSVQCGKANNNTRTEHQQHYYIVQWPENGGVGALLANRLLHMLGAGESLI